MSSASVGTDSVGRALRYYSLVYDVGGYVCRHIFLQMCKRGETGSLAAFLKANKENIGSYTVGDDRRKVFTNEQIEKLYPGGKAAKSAEEFDISLSLCLLRTFFFNDEQQSKPMWKRDLLDLLVDKETTPIAELARIRGYTYKIVDKSTSLSEKDFWSYWTDLTRIFLQFGKLYDIPQIYKKIDDLLHEPLDEAREKKLENEMRQLRKEVARSKEIEELSPLEMKGKRGDVIHKVMTTKKPTEATFESSKSRFRNFPGSLDEIKRKCEDICKEQELAEDVVKAFCGYTVDARDIIVFQCISKKEKATDKEPYSDCDIKYKTIDCHNEEDEHMVVAEQKYKSIDQKEKDEIESLISAKKDKLFKEHSHLMNMFACNVKSTGHGTNHKINETPCIVFLVQCKGVIPLDEERLPPDIGKFPTDVREAYFYRQVGGEPKKKHQRIKMGCEIGSTEKLAGTISLFVNKGSKRLKGMTCAHVFLNNDELNALKKMLNTFLGKEDAINLDSKVWKTNVESFAMSGLQMN